MKDNPKNQTFKEQYLDVVEVMQTRVSRAVTHARYELKAFEKEYFAKHCSLPSSVELFFEIKAKRLADKIKYKKALLGEWHSKAI